ncbi:MAG: ATP-binding protein [Planctomycetes bacterium]|nr:ATP-binding protein [Planctomycetota bacterium]
MTQADIVRVTRRFQRSIRIDTDLGAKQALDGFICPQSFAEVLTTMSRHVQQTKHTAFTWTGPYGGGKSSLAIAFGALLGGDSVERRNATSIFGSQLTNKITSAFATGSKGWHVVPVVGLRDNPVNTIGSALVAAGLALRAPRGGWSETSLIEEVSKASTGQKHGGIALIIDEMGKFLEHAAQNGTDIYVFQQLAEAANRSNGRFLFIGILHQAFGEYATRLSTQLRDDWIKIQGRFVDLAVNVTTREQVDLISRAIEAKRNRNKAENEDRVIAEAIDRRNKNLAQTLAMCWPLHPVVACLLGPISRRRFGQNQRSIFGFLNSAEPHGFQDYLEQAADDARYMPEQLWNYLRANLEPSILASPDGHRWALAANAVDKCESRGGDVLQTALLKTIGVINLFKEQSGIVASNEVLSSCFPLGTKRDLTKALAQLQEWSLIRFKKYEGAYAIVAGSDFDMEQALQEALDESASIDTARLEALAGIQPVLAKKHYHETGAMRWFEIKLVTVADLAATKYDTASTNLAGRFLLAIPTQGESAQQCVDACRTAARHSDHMDIVAGVSDRTSQITRYGLELVALDDVREHHPELREDDVARQEVDARIATVEGLLESELNNALDEATWYRKHQKKPKRLRRAEISKLASDLASKRFDKCPRIHNELLNRARPSASAISAQNELLRRMVVEHGKERLGIEGFPAHGGLFSSILEKTGLYAQQDGSWQFCVPPPSEHNLCRLRPMWDATTEYLREHSSSTVSIQHIYRMWSNPPYGVKEGLMPVLIVAFIMSQRDKIALYRDNVFRARFDDVDIGYLAKDPQTIQIRWMDLSGVDRDILTGIADVVGSLHPEAPISIVEPLAVGRQLIAIYEDLPHWTKRTMRLSKQALQLRDLFKRATDPNQLLFSAIPNALNGDGHHTQDTNAIVNRVRDSLQELVSTFPSMLHRLKSTLLTELHVPNESPQALAELRGRAENIRGLSGDFNLDAFVVRLTQFDATNSSMESIASLAAEKPPRDWTDADLDRATVRIVELAEQFLRAETFTRVKGRPAKRHALAVVVGKGGRPTPYLEEFSIGESDKAAVDDLVRRITGELERADPSTKNVILAALAEISASFMQPTVSDAPEN